MPGKRIILLNFLKFVKTDLAGSRADFGDAFVRKLQKSVEEVKTSREMGERYMVLEEMLRVERTEGREEGRAEGKVEGKAETVIEILAELGAVPEHLRDQIMKEKDLSRLKKMVRAAVNADTIEQFEEKLRDLR